MNGELECFSDEHFIVLVVNIIKYSSFLLVTLNWKARVKKRKKNGELEEAQSFPCEVWCFSSREQVT